MSESFAYRHVLLDTGPLVAIANQRDGQHARCVETLKQIEPPLWTCWPVITEAAWLLRHYPPAWETVVNVLARGVISLLPLDASELSSMNAFLARYRNLPLQLADAVLLYLADRDGLETVFTLHQRDFAHVQLRNKRHLTLLPEAPR